MKFLLVSLLFAVVVYWALCTFPIPRCPIEWEIYLESQDRR